MSINKAGTFVYSPDISCAISTINHGVIDVSSDIVSFDMERNIGSASTFSCILNNPKRKYNRVINTMDRITVFLKRTQYVQCFTGVVTYAPIETFVPTPVTISASCTLYLLQNTYWDDTLIQYQSLLLNYMDQAAYSSDQTYNDGGVAQAIVNVLYKVCNWNPSAIHIQGIPPNFVSFVANAWANLNNTQNLIDQNIYSQLGGILSINGVVSGQQVSPQVPADLKPPDKGVGVTIEANYVKPFITTSINHNKPNFPGNNPDNPVALHYVDQDIYYCSAPFSYLMQKKQKVKDDAKAWLAHNDAKNTDDGRLLILTNQSANRSVAVRTTSIPQVPNTSYKGAAVYDHTVDYFQCHPGVVDYLNGTISSPSNWKPSVSTASQVNVSFQWADSKKVVVGPQPIAAPTVPSTYNPPPVVQNSINEAIATLIKNARTQIGDAYGRGSGEYDCSSFVNWAYSTIGITLAGNTTAGGGSGGSNYYPKTTGTTATTMTTEEWAKGLLNALQQKGYAAPDSTNNIQNIQRQIQAETGTQSGGFLRDINPWNLNTYPGSQTSLPGGYMVKESNGLNVQVFNSLTDCYNAYVSQLINDSRGQSLLNALNRSSSAKDYGTALLSSGWYGQNYVGPTKFPTYGAYQRTTTIPGSTTVVSVGNAGECGPITGTSPNMTGLFPEIYGEWIDNQTQPQVGDLLFWEVPGDNTPLPQHVTMLSVGIDSTGYGKTIQANETGVPLSETPFYWPGAKGGQWQSWHGRLIGCRRPITLHHGWGAGFNQGLTVNNTSKGVSTPSSTSNPNSSSSNSVDPIDPYQRSALTLTGSSYAYLQPPQYDPRASVMQGSPGAFVLDHPVLQDLTTIIGAGLRQFQSAPNGDFVAWFPDYYGVYGTDPALEISPVEIIDMQIYHDDTQLATHVAIIGDTTGASQSGVTLGDYLTFQGIVSVQDVTTMQILFGSNNITQQSVTSNIQNVVDFLSRYGLRPYFQEQSVIHTHSLEYIYALYTFMTQWSLQFASNVSLTFMPELYPGMRVHMKMDNESGGVDQYEFYVTSVTHTGDRSGGFLTNAVFTAPKKNGQIFHYGLDIVQ